MPATKLLLIGQTFGDALSLLKCVRTIGQNHELGRIRAIHSGAITVALWACEVPTEVIAAAAAVPNISLDAFLTSTLPANAAQCCERRQVTILTQPASSLFKRSCNRHTRWASRQHLVETIVKACTLAPLLWPAESTAALAKEELARLARRSVVLGTENGKARLIKVAIVGN